MVCFGSRFQRSWYISTPLIVYAFETYCKSCPHIDRPNGSKSVNRCHYHLFMAIGSSELAYLEALMAFLPEKKCECMTYRFANWNANSKFDIGSAAVQHFSQYGRGGEHFAFHFQGCCSEWRMVALKKFNGTGLSGKDNASSCARSYKIYDMHFRADRGGGGGAPPMTSQFRVWCCIACHMTCAHSSALSFAYSLQNNRSYINSTEVGRERKK